MQYSRHANLLRLVRLVLFFLIINHYVACIWYGGVASESFKANMGEKSGQHLYLVSFYSMMLVIMGQNIDVFEDGEYAFCIAGMLFGAVLMAVVFGNVAILIANYYENQSNHQRKMEWLFASMSRMKLPMDLQNRINDYYQAMWERHGTLDGAVTAFIPELSRNLAYEVELFLRMDMINRAPIFQSCSAKVVQELVMELELQVFMAGDYIVVRGEVGNDMYFVQNGVCEVTKDIAPSTTESLSHIRRSGVDFMANEIVLKTLGQGDYFGEIALLMNCKRTANVRAQVFSELCALTREVFENISMRYLEDRNIIEKFIMDKYDPSMLQAAMKQSQELSSRSSAVSLQQHRPSLFGKRGATPVTDPDAVDMLRRIEDRLVRLESRLEQEATERRESGAVKTSPPAGPLGERLPNSEFVLFEPDRVSQRHLLRPLRHSATSAFIHETSTSLGVRSHSAASNTIANISDAVTEGIATDEPPDERKQMWKRPSMIRSGSWRSARRDSTTDSLRLRGLAKPQASTTSRHASRSSSLTAAIAAAEAVSLQHSMFHAEPPSRDEGDGEAPEHEMINADSLDDLASTLAQHERAVPET
ncbi:hypothetical protein ATCC90586_005047 [Pythium insidiosum]|nr:hypothetical protein ATCC90586_005047 [Pythium insidiosum]